MPPPATHLRRERTYANSGWNGMTRLGTLSIVLWTLEPGSQCRLRLASGIANTVERLQYRGARNSVAPRGINVDAVNQRLILLPGLGVDHRLFIPQQDLFSRLEVPPWIP